MAVSLDGERDEKWDALGAVIDALISTDYTARGISTQLFAAARRKSGRPLALDAAQHLHNRVRPGDPVLICTGWPSRSWLMSGLTETDGPVGAAYLGRTVEQCLGAVPIMVVHPDHVHFAEVALRSAGLIVADVDTALASKRGPHRASVGAVLALTSDVEGAAIEASSAIERLRPGAVVAIEMPGAAEDGCYHNVTGRQVPTNLVAKADALVVEAGKHDILTIGIGDGGNELGMGHIADDVQQLLPGGAAVAPSTDVDLLVVGVVSNFGAVGVSAALAAITNKPRLLRTVDLLRITERLSDAGAIDGLTAYLDPKNDGLDREATSALVELLAISVEMHLDGWNKG